MPAGAIELAYMRVGDALRGPARNELRWVAGGVEGAAGIVASDNFLPSGITSGKLFVRSSGGGYSRVRRLGVLGDGEGGAGKRAGTEVGARVIVALSDFERAWPRVVTKKRFLVGGSVNVGLIGDRRGEDFREAGKSSDGCADRISDVVVVFATGGNGFASGIGGGGVEKNVECGMFERAPPAVGREYAPVAGWIRILCTCVVYCMQGGRGAERKDAKAGWMVSLERDPKTNSSFGPGYLFKGLSQKRFSAIGICMAELNIGLNGGARETAK
jgi:hypothetical protein